MAAGGVIEVLFAQRSGSRCSWAYMNWYRANEIRKFVPSVIVLRTVLYVTWRNVNNTLYMSHFVFIGICYAKMQKYVTTIFVK